MPTTELHDKHSDVNLMIIVSHDIIVAQDNRGQHQQLPDTTTLLVIYFGQNTHLLSAVSPSSHVLVSAAQCLMMGGNETADSDHP